MGGRMNAQKVEKYKSRKVENLSVQDEVQQVRDTARYDVVVVYQRDGETHRTPLAVNVRGSVAVNRVMDALTGEIAHYVLMTEERDRPGCTDFIVKALADRRRTFDLRVGGMFFTLNGREYSVNRVQTEGIV